MKALERLRQLKAKAVDRMAELNSLATKETRELSASEKLEYDTQKATAEELASEITELEKATTAPAIPAVAQPDVTALAKAATDAERSRVSTIRERLTAARLPVELATNLEKEMVDGGLSIELASTRIFAELAKRDSALPETRTGLAVQRGDLMAQVETLARTVAGRDGLSKEKSTVSVLNGNPKLYDQYLQANPAQTGRQ